MRHALVLAAAAACSTPTRGSDEAATPVQRGSSQPGAAPAEVIAPAAPPPHAAFAAALGGLTRFAAREPTFDCPGGVHWLVTGIGDGEPGASCALPATEG